MKPVHLGRFFYVFENLTNVIFSGCGLKDFYPSLQALEARTKNEETMEPVLLALFGVALWGAELFKPGFFFGSLGIGAFFASIGAYLELDPYVLMGLVHVGAIVGFYGIRPLTKKVFDKDDYLSDPDDLVGHVGRVEKMPLGEHLGQLDIDGDTWSFVFQGTAANVNELVRVVRHEATVLYVEKANPKK